jgi:hypothetical protein
MYSMWAVLVYLAAIGIPVYLLYRFRSQAWYWHILAITAGVALGFVPTPPELKSATYDLLFGFVLAMLLIWGVGGLVVFRPHAPHREKHA